MNATSTPIYPDILDPTTIGEPSPPSEVQRDDIDRIPVIYVAGPYSAEDPWGVEKNVRAAEDACYELEALGACVVCPHTNTRFQDKRTPYEQKIRTTLAAMRRCDAVFFLRYWYLSSGARGEHEEAKQRRMVLLFDMLDAGKWIAGRLGRAA